MTKVIYKFALLVSIISFVLCTVFGISLFTGLVRSLIVYIGILFIFFLAGHTLRWGILLTEHKTKPEEE